MEVSDDQFCTNLIENAIRALRGNKPQDKSDKARFYAVTITEMEKVYAYFRIYVLDNDYENTKNDVHA